jgi:hypothetical protein
MAELLQRGSAGHRVSKDECDARVERRLVSVGALRAAGAVHRDFSPAALASPRTHRENPAMTRNALRVHTDAAEIARLRQLIEQLADDARVTLRLEDGSELTGIVAARPMTQVFFDAQGREGTNATVRIEQPALDRPESAGWQDVWVDSIVEVKRLDPEDTLAGPQLQR